MTAITDNDLQDAQRYINTFLDIALTGDSIPTDICLDAWVAWTYIDAAAKDLLEQQDLEILKLRADNLRLATALMPVFNTIGGNA